MDSGLDTEKMKRMPLKFALSATKQKQFTHISGGYGERPLRNIFRKQKKPKVFANPLHAYLFSKAPYIYFQEQIIGLSLQ